MSVPSREAQRWDADALGVLLASFTGTEVPGWLGEALDAGLAGTILFGYNTPDAAACRDLARALHERAPGAIVTIDEEGGDVTRIQAVGGSALPTAWALGAADDPALTRAAGRALGGLLAACDVDMDLAPVLDVSTDPRNPVIGTRAFGDDPELVARHARELAAGLRDTAVASCGKHFPGHGATHTDSHTGLPRIDLPLAQIETEHLAPWSIAPQLDAVMTAHVEVPALGEGPASISPWSRPLLDRIVGGSGFEGLIITDALDMAAVAADPGPREAVVRAVEAGAHLLCLGTSLRRDEQEMLREAHDALVAAVESGRIPREVLAERARQARAAIAAIRARRAEQETPDLEEALAAVRAVGAEAARRAVRVPECALRGPRVRIIDARRRADHASGSRRSVLGELLRERGLVVLEDASDSDAADTVLILTRLPRADEGEARVLAEALAAHPEAIVVHVGVPGAAPDHDRVALALGHGPAMLSAVLDAMGGERP